MSNDNPTQDESVLHHRSSVPHVEAHQQIKLHP